MLFFFKGISTIISNFSNATDNFIAVRATGYLTDNPSAETNFAFTVGLTATFVGLNITQTYSNVVSRNGTERPIMIVNRTDLTSGTYLMGYVGKLRCA